MKTLLLFLSLIVATSQAATVRLYFTDPLTNDKDTNAFYITPIGTNVLSSGGVVGRGVTTRYVPASNGYRTNTLAVGHYSITYRSLGSGVVIRVPDSSSLYDYTNILISGYNIFVTITNGDSGTSGALTNNDTRAVTFDTSLTIGAGSAANSIHPSAGLLTFSNSILANGSYIKGHSIIGTNFVGNGASLTNLHGSNSIAAGTIDTNKMDATAYAAFVGGGDVTQAGLAAGSVTNIIYVSKNGSDSTGTGSYYKPFLTLTNAKAIAVAGQTIHVAPGIYTNQNNLSKNGVNWHYEAGATNLYIQTTTNDAGWGIYDDRTVSGGCKMTVSGEGAFIWIGVSNVTAFYDQVEDDSTFNFNPNSLGCIVQTNSLSDCSYKAKLVSGNGWTGYPAYSIYMLNGLASLDIDAVTNLTRGVNYTLLSLSTPSQASGLLSANGTVSLYTKTFQGEPYAWVWFPFAASTNNTYIKANKIFGNLYGDAAQSTTNSAFGWVTADELDASDSHGIGVPISCYGSGRWYFDIKKIKAYTGKAVVDTFANVGSTNVQVWVTAQKIESDTKFVEANCGEVWISCQDWKFTGGSLLNGITAVSGAIVYPQYSISIKTNIAAATATLLVNLVPPMPGTNYSPRASFGFSGVTNHWFTSLNRSNVTLNIQTGGSAGGAVFVEAKQNVQ